MKLELLIDSEQFWPRFQSDIRAARKRIYVQTLSFEGDAVGLALAEEFNNSKTPDKRIIVDCYTKYIISDKFRYSPRNWFDSDLKSERKETFRMINSLPADGTGIKWVNPFGFLLVRTPSRNHKKILIVDDNISYIGGINFSDHNFAWHDMMVRIESIEIAEFLAQDFMESWEDRHFSGTREFDKLTLISCDGKNNAACFQPIMEMIDNAQTSIYIQSPYLSFPFTDRLRNASRRGVKIEIVTPENNNKNTLEDFIKWESDRSGFDLHLYPGRMTHLKAMLIDGKGLILGSSNFDCFSYRFEQENMAIITDKDFIAEFTRKVIEPDRAKSEPFNGSTNHPKGCFLDLEMRAISKIAEWFNG